VKVVSRAAKVVVGRRVCGELRSKDRLWVVTWRTTGREWVAGPGVTRGVPRRGDANRDTGHCLGLTMLSSIVLAVLLVIGGVERNPGPVEGDNTVQLLCTGCGRNLRSGIQCELYGRW
jgi:hypothetical protein